MVSVADALRMRNSDENVNKTRKEKSICLTFTYYPTVEWILRFDPIYIPFYTSSPNAWCVLILL